MANSLKCGKLQLAEDVLEAMLLLENPKQREILQRFFKTGIGEYGEGDCFLGLKVPETRAIAREARDLKLEEVQKLLDSNWHEVRLCGFLVLVHQFERLCGKVPQCMEVSLTEKSDGVKTNGELIEKEKIVRRDEIVEFYLRNAVRANNWDLVDLSCYKILGKWLFLASKYSNEEKCLIMDGLAASENLWERRISMVSTMAALMTGDFSFTWKYAAFHIEMFSCKPEWSQDLMHKAVGWMLREMGKRCDMDVLRDFLFQYAAVMPRTTLRYAIERMSDEEREAWMRRE